MPAVFGSSQDGESEDAHGTTLVLNDVDSSEVLSLPTFLCTSKESRSPKAKQLLARQGEGF